MVTVLSNSVYFWSEAFDVFMLGNPSSGYTVFIRLLAALECKPHETVLKD